MDGRAVDGRQPVLSGSGERHQRGSDVVQGRSVSWTVSGSNPVRIELLVGRLDSRHQTVQDTVLLYFGS